ncbi:type II toxin-antitoxin system HipA family toxin [Parashewanella spongiae]|uniref:Type II toxin-antitoxin system HipA family toxin n=1 Tax=Parashewanella spongiae TaxID=342950 RepID=A0A3A6TRH0_9GAMM|nr:type II toxin-antitoxin system HipA family toxin [Parashewanella spongiae]MCL1077055.1 type II toxin-antitoxin system HipA family toxin [Parashewanella spongiae]RJY18731.1 type II toxin-antitoxin system HipA family toxin [Parashewanella spongiae]
MKLHVSLNDFVVGYLSKDKHGGLYFEYTSEWLSTAGARPISLSLPLTAQKYSGEIVYNFFDNLLPDNPAIRNKIQSRFQLSTNHAFDLLAAIGHDCVGAIQLSQHAPVSVKTMQYESLTETDIEQLLAGYREAPLGMLAEDTDFRISIAGAQEKTALLKIGDTWNKPIGSTPTSHILKLPMGELPHVNIDLSESCENEFVCLELARALGFEAARSEVVQFGSQRVLSVERFDRKYARDGSWLMRLPQEDFCQAMGMSSALKYQADGGPDIQACMKLLSASSCKEDRDTFFSSQILFWLLAGIDGHAKNFSVYLMPDNRYRMTPLYDILSAHPLMQKPGGLAKQKIKMAMSLKGKNTQWKWDKILPRHFLSTARQVGYSELAAKQTLERIADELETAIELVESKIPTQFPEHIAAAIFAGVRGRAKRIAI